MFMLWKVYQNAADKDSEVPHELDEPHLLAQTDASNHRPEPGRASQS